MKSNFNKRPVVNIKGEDDNCVSGWDNLTKILKQTFNKGTKQKIVVVVETYQGILDTEVLNELKDRLQPDEVILAEEAYLSEERVLDITHEDITDDRIFGFMTRLDIHSILDAQKVAESKRKIEDIQTGLILVYGTGASQLVNTWDYLVYADMARWEIQLRMRRNEISNLGISNYNDPFETTYKRSYFVDWRICDRLKKELMDTWDFVLDTTIPNQPKLATGDAVRNGLKQAVQQPFSVVPYFDEGPWGGQWMKEVCDLDKSKKNYAWCFNCVPEENSMILSFGGTELEIPSINVVFYQPDKLLGEAVHGRFGDEFPIRFDFLDTMDGGNLSLQVHPLTEYIQEHFGVNYTQDESYYMLDAEDDAVVYLGLKEGIDGNEMIADLKKSEKEAVLFDDTKYVEQWPAKKHDHFLIPGGTVHCSGTGGMVLEISATPYIFTFKLWDWGRLGLDGKPRPINIDHGSKVIQWNRDTNWTEKNLVNRIEKVAEGDGWVEEKTGLHEREFIETRRHWFTKMVPLNTNGGVHVLNLVEGREVIVESPTDAFDPFVVHYAETFIVPAEVGEYTIRPFGESKGKQCGIITAFVRTGVN